MSRSSKGFADFFPTAPSVVAQKRSKAAQIRNRPRSPRADEGPVARASLAQHASSEREKGPAPTDSGTSSGPTRVLNNAPGCDEAEIGSGDLLNGVGSASSTSTSSSVFSNSYHPRSHAPRYGNGSSTSLTPMTVVDSSPPDHGHGSPERKDSLHHTMSRTSQMPSPHVGTTQTTSNPDLGRKQARPPKGEAKGCRVVYDPDLVPSKERKNKKVQYETFGELVCYPKSQPVFFIQGTGRLTGQLRRATSQFRQTRD